MSEYTPGPWHYQEESDAYTHIVRSENNEYIGSSSQGSDPRNEANARLMAAAPDMRKALKIALEFFYNPTSFDVASVERMYKEVLAKADSK